MPPDDSISLKAARETLGVTLFATPAELRRAFREAAKAAHPDRTGGDGEPFRRVVQAYHRLQRTPAPQDRIIQPPAPIVEPAPTTLAITPLVALQGGVADHRLADGRHVRVTLPAGLRQGDTVRVAGAELAVVVAGAPDLMVRGHDLWITVKVDPRTLAEGGRLALDTPIGRRIVWVTQKAGERGLVRIVGQGLPARGAHPEGHLFLRLAPRAAGRADSAARTLLRRFAAAWAA